MIPSTGSDRRSLLRAMLDADDGHGFFQALGDSAITGPTLTNVNDFRAIVIDSAAPRESR
jgi:glycerate-2-kinase